MAPGAYGSPAAVRSAVPVPCDRVLFFRRGQAMPVSPAGITRVLWRRCEQPQDGGATLWGGLCCSLGFSTSLHRLGARGHTYGTCCFGPWRSDAVVLGSFERRGKGNNAGIPHTRISYAGREISPSIADHDSKAGLALDRRVDVTVVPRVLFQSTQVPRQMPR